MARRPARQAHYDRKDAHYRRARVEGYRARSAYKLIELDDRYRLLRPGDVVVDLGAWPGAWTQVAARRVGPGGRVIGLDVARLEPFDSERVVSLAGDVRDPATVEELSRRVGGLASVVLCDLAPKLTGVRATDEARAAELVVATLDALPTLLRPGGRFLLKLFMGSELPAMLEGLRARFDQVRTTRPEATRRGSSELYAVAAGYRHPCG